MTTDASQDGASTSSHSGSPNGDGNVTDAGSGSSETAPTSEPSPSSYPSTIDAMALTTSSLLTLQEVAFPLSLGLSEREVAKQQGKTRRELEGELDMLRSELEQQG